VVAEKTDMRYSLSVGDSQYLPEMFIIEEGRDSFHEYVHYWQHVGTTFGAFQIIGFHITAKAMRIVIRELISTNMMEVPVRETTLERLLKQTTRKEVRNIFSYIRMLKRFESIPNRQIVPLNNSSEKVFLGGWHNKMPIFKLTDSLGSPITASQVKEIHNFAIGQLRGKPEKLGAYEKSLWMQAESYLGKETSRFMALLCDFALMVPNPNLISKKKGEIHPGFRLLKGLEVLTNANNRKRKELREYKALFSWLTNSLGWEGYDTVMSHYDSFIDLAKHGSENKRDAVRNRRTYLAIATMLKAARKLRKKTPDVIAFPHNHQSELLNVLPPVAIKQARHLLRTPEAFSVRGEASDWYFSYLNSVSLSRQIFGFKDNNKHKIECVYRHLRIEDNCTYLRKAEPHDECFSYPAPPNRRWIECGFLKQCNELGFSE